MTLKHLNGIRFWNSLKPLWVQPRGLILAELGADVIKVEPAPNGDKTRRLEALALVFSGLNRNKRGLAVDLKSPEGREVAHKLVTEQNVILENFAPGTMERLGCGFKELSY